MIIVMKHGSTQENVDKIVEVLKAHGLGANLSTGAQATIIGVIGDKSALAGVNLEMMDGVDKCVPIMHSYKLASREMCPDGRVAEVGGQRIGGKQLVLMAGPCAVESEEQILEAAQGVKAAGATFLRGGAYKPRTSPYAFQGMEDEGFKMLRQAADATGLKATVDSSVFLGLNTHYFAHTDDGDKIEIIQESQIDSIIPDGTVVRLGVKTEKINVFDAEGKQNLLEGVRNDNAV